MLKRPLYRRPRRRKNQVSLASTQDRYIASSFPSSVVRKEKDLHGVHCAILSCDGITH